MEKRSYWLRNAVWENPTKDRIKATLETVQDNKTTRQEMIVSRLDAKGNPNKTYQEIIDHVTVIRIDQNTAKIQSIEREKQKNNDQARKDAENTKRLEQLFQMKIDAFEVPEIKSSTNRELKSKLRKSKNQLEVSIYSAMIAIDTMLNPPIVESTTEATTETNNETNNEQQQ